MPLTYYGESSVAYPAIFGGTAAPSTYYFGLQFANTLWTASTVTAAGVYVMPNAFNTFTTSGTGNNRIFVSVSSGTTGTTEPTWTSVTAGGTVTDGTVTWQDVASTSTPYWLSTAPSFNEVNGNAYARVSYSNTTSNFPAPSGTSPTSGTNANIITFPTATGTWGLLAAVSIHDAATGGDTVAFAYLSKYLSVTSGITPSIPASTGLTLSLT